MNSISTTDDTLPWRSLMALLWGLVLSVCIGLSQSSDGLPENGQSLVRLEQQVWGATSREISHASFELTKRLQDDPAFGTGSEDHWADGFFLLAAWLVASPVRHTPGRFPRQDSRQVRSRHFAIPLLRAPPSVTSFI